MQEEPNQFERNKEWTLVPIPHGKTIIGTKWTWKNKMDKHGVVVKNKARLEAIRIFLAYAAYTGFVVFQMDLKSAFLNGKISEEVYVQQPLGFESSEFPDHVCKLDKALYGLKQAPRAWYETLSKFLLQHKFVRGFQIKQDFKGISICQEKYVKDLLKKYDLADSSSMKCPMLPPNNLGPNESRVSVNETLFIGMIGSLMYLTTSKSDIQFSTCLVLGSGFDLKAYSDLNYDGCNLDRKSTSGGYQILGGILACWSAKKQRSVAMSSAEANRCCWILFWYTAEYTKNFSPLPPKETVMAALTTLGLVDENNPELSSIALINSSLLRIRYFSTTWKSKATTDKRPKKKKIPSSSDPKASKDDRVTPPKKQVTDTQPTEETVATADAAQSLDASVLAEEQGN
ncbi:retrovirus-related pol polyprotein from transposon TNT 1-94 [Tanacetum coccineum]